MSPFGGVQFSSITDEDIKMEVSSQFGSNTDSEEAATSKLISSGKSIWIDIKIDGISEIGTYAFTMKSLLLSDWDLNQNWKEWNPFNSRVSQSIDIGPDNHLNVVKSGEFEFGFIDDVSDSDSDDGAHEEISTDRQEWWYLTGFMDVKAVGASDTKRIGVMVCYFITPKLFILLLTDEEPNNEKFYQYWFDASEVGARSEVGNDKLDLKYTSRNYEEVTETGVEIVQYVQDFHRLDEDPFNDPWTLRVDVEGREINGDELDHFSFGVTIGASTTPLLIDGDGKIQMGWSDPTEETQYSYYYSVIDYPSVPGIGGSGNENSNYLIINDVEYEIVTADLWLDRQWGSWQSPLESKHAYYNGYNWLAVYLFNDVLFMNQYTMLVKYSGWIESKPTYYSPGENPYHSYTGMFITRDTWRRVDTMNQREVIYPVNMIFKDPATNLFLEIDATVDDQEVIIDKVTIDGTSYGFQFWEGLCTVSGYYKGEQVSGRATLESPEFGGIYKFI